jgi:hypothetical protein
MAVKADTCVIVGWRELPRPRQRRGRELQRPSRPAAEAEARKEGSPLPRPTQLWAGPGIPVQSSLGPGLMLGREGAAKAEEREEGREEAAVSEEGGSQLPRSAMVAASAFATAHLMKRS